MFSTAHNVSLSDSTNGVLLFVDGSQVAMVGNDGKLTLFAQAGGPPSPFKGMLLDPAFKIIVA